MLYSPHWEVSGQDMRMGGGEAPPPACLLLRRRKQEGGGPHLGSLPPAHSVSGGGDKETDLLHLCLLTCPPPPA